MRILILGKIAPTFGFNIKTLEYKTWKLNCWDVGGQKSLRSYWRNYFERTDAVIWVVDSADVMRIGEDCARELHSLVNEECLHGVTLLVMANKCDLDSALSLEQITELLRLSEIKQHHWKIFETSAYTGHNLLISLDWLCNDVASRVLLPE
uniref:ADP-ribosylation factor 1-like 2 n=1 Tax=Ditylenchus dipsaci TaxID=166011 RepID=A0A915DKN7_9BILA